MMLNSLWVALPAVPSLFADASQSSNPADDASGAAAGGMCCIFMIFLVVVPVILLAVNVAILFWVAKDAKSRGMDGAMWLFLIFFTGVVGLAIYLFSRPQGLLIQCHNCGNNRMATSIKCPNCSADQERQQMHKRPEEDKNDPDVGQQPGRQAVPVAAGRPASVVVACPHCGERLSLPKQALTTSNQFSCPKCKNTFKAGSSST